MRAGEWLTNSPVRSLGSKLGSAAASSAQDSSHDRVLRLVDARLRGEAVCGLPSGISLHYQHLCELHHRFGLLWVHLSLCMLLKGGTREPFNRGIKMFTDMANKNARANATANLIPSKSESWPIFPDLISASPWEGLYDASIELIP
jgi:hypothetical protein